MRRRGFLMCVAASVVVAQTPLGAVALASVDAGEPWHFCEGCQRPLYEGDLAFVYWDGPVLCEEHAPTWADLKAEQDELIESGDFGGLFEDDEEAGRARLAVLRKIAEGLGDIRVVYPL